MHTSDKIDTVTNSSGSNVGERGVENGHSQVAPSEEVRDGGSVSGGNANGGSNESISGRHDNPSQNLSFQSGSVPSGSSDTAGGAHSIPAAAPAPAPAPNLDILMIGKVTPADPGAAVDPNKHPLLWSGFWGHTEADFLPTGLTSAFSYRFTVQTGPQRGAPPLHTAPVAIDALPSLKEHDVIQVPISGSFNYKLKKNEITGLYDEEVHREGNTQAKGGKQQYPCKIRIGKEVSADSYKPADVPLKELVGVVGDGKNHHAPWTFSGCYHPLSGRMWVTRRYIYKLPKVAGSSVPKTTSPGEVKTRRTGDSAESTSSSSFFPAVSDAPVNPEWQVEPTVEMKRMMEVYKAIRNNKFRPMWFIEPVNTTLLPDYLTVIKEPMCLKDVEKKLVTGVYVTQEAFVRDMDLIWSNAKTYNKPPSQVINDAIFYEKKMKEVLEQHEKQREREKKRLEKIEEDRKAQLKEAEEEKLKEKAEKRKREELQAARQASLAKRSRVEGESDADRSKDTSVAAKKPPPIDNLTQQMTQLSSVVQKLMEVHIQQMAMQTAGAISQIRTKELSGVLAETQKALGLGPDGVMSIPGFSSIASGGFPGGIGGAATSAGEPQAKKQQKTKQHYLEDDVDFDDDDDFKVGKGKGKKRESSGGGKRGGGKAGGMRGGKASSSTAHARPADALPLSHEEMQKLSDDASKLSETDMSRLLQFLQERKLVPASANGEIELDMETLPPATLRTMQKEVVKMLSAYAPAPVPVHVSTSAAGRGGQKIDSNAQQKLLDAAAAVAAPRIGAAGGGGGSSSSGGGAFASFEDDDLPPPPSY
jgi:hypothetical protein